MAAKCEQLERARQQGNSRYFTGRPCMRGHVAERLTKNKTCIECLKIHGATFRATPKAKAYSEKWQSDNAAPVAEKKKAYRVKNRDKIRAWNLAWSRDNKDKVRASGKRYTANNKEKIRAYRTEYLKNNRDKPNATSARRRAMKKNAQPAWASTGYINLFYTLAKIESARIGLPVEVDHIIPLVNDSVCGLHCEHNMQLLTVSDNRSKSNTFNIGVNNG